MAVKSARDRFSSRHPDVEAPEMILAVTGHPAFEKAAHYFRLKPIHIPVAMDFRANIDAMKQAISPRTAIIIGSAPSYPHGVVDPIAEMAQIALEEEILFHVDACVGGFMLPFMRRLGYPVPDFDFRVPGVTSISADLHKYGYAIKGASLILYRNPEIRRHQLFAYVDWPGGIYASPTFTGTRPAGPIAASWALMKFLGEEGYVRIADQVMRATRAIHDGIEAIEGIEVLGEPDMSLMAIGSDSLDVYQIGDEMTAMGWHLDRQQFPPSLHMTVNHAHLGTVDIFLGDLARAVEKVRKPSIRKMRDRLLLGLVRGAVKILPSKLVNKMSSRLTSWLGVSGEGIPQRSAPMYGMMGTLPNRGDLKTLVLDLVEQFTIPQEHRAAKGDRDES